jgi:hypothetical protein
VSDLRRRRQNQHRGNSFRAGQPQQTVANPGQANHQPRRRQGSLPAAEASSLRDPDQSLASQSLPGFTPPGIIHSLGGVEQNIQIAEVAMTEAVVHPEV